jgi:hypothetical protein
LYWVAHGDSLPDEMVMGELEKPDKEAFLVRGYNADSFFLALVTAAGRAPEEILAEAEIPIRPRTRVAGPPASAPAVERWRNEERLVVPEPRPGLILNLPLFNRKGYDSPKELVMSVSQPSFRPRALTSNWGPLAVAVEHHAGTLRHCWVVCSPQARDDFPHAVALISAVAPGTECHQINLENQNSIVDVQQKILKVYESFGPACGLSSSDIIADITGGNSAMTGGTVLATLDEERAIEYLRQDTRLVQKNEQGVDMALSREDIREKQLLIGIRTTGEMVRDVVLRSGGALPA